MQTSNQPTTNNNYFSEKTPTRFAYFGLKTQRRRVVLRGVTCSYSPLLYYFYISVIPDVFLLPVFVLFAVYLLFAALFCVLGMFILFRVYRSLGELIYVRLY